MWAFLKPVKGAPSRQKTTTIPAPKPAYKDNTYLYFIFITVLFACCFFQIFTNLPVYFKKGLHLSEPYIGFIMALNGILIALVEMVIVYKLEGKRKNTAYITAGVALVGISFFVLNLPLAGPVIALGMVTLVTFGEMLAMPFMNTYWIGRTQDSNRGQYAALYTMAWSAAQTLGPMGGAVLAQNAGFVVLWWTVGGLALLASFSFWRLHKLPED
jgi:predicted MFS family arabinose efflux permease